MARVLRIACVDSELSRPRRMSVGEMDQILHAKLPKTFSEFLSVFKVWPGALERDKSGGHLACTQQPCGWNEVQLLLQARRGI